MSLGTLAGWCAHPLARGVFEGPGSFSCHVQGPAYATASALRLLSMGRAVGLHCAWACRACWPVLQGSCVRRAMARGPRAVPRSKRSYHERQWRVRPQLI